MNTRTGGIRGEAEAVHYITGLGMTVLSRNFRAAGGEIDLIARDGNTVAFIEVKARRSPRYGAPEEAVTPAKMRNIVRAATAYLQKNGLLDAPVRFDVLAMEGEDIRYYRAAFDATDLY